MSTQTDYFAFAKTYPAPFVNPPEGGFVILLGENEIREAVVAVTQKQEARGLPAEWARLGIVYRDQYGG